MGGMTSQPRDNLTAKEIRELEATFIMFDEDGSGSISADELGQVLRALGQNPTEEEVMTMLDDVDADGSGTIDIDEFVNMMAKRSKGHEKEIKLAYSAFDNHDIGYIDAKCLREVMNSLGERSVTDEDIAAMLKAAHCDGQGRVNKPGFESLMKAILSESEGEAPAGSSPATSKPGTPGNGSSKPGTPGNGSSKPGTPGAVDSPPSANGKRRENGAVANGSAVNLEGGIKKAQ